MQKHRKHMRRAKNTSLAAPLLKKKSQSPTFNIFTEHSIQNLTNREAAKNKQSEMTRKKAAKNKSSEMTRKKRERGGAKQQQSKMAEATRIRIIRALEQFQDSNDQVFSFWPELLNNERAFVHEKCRRMDMKSKSTGKGKNRRVVVHKLKKNVTTNNDSENLTQLTFSESTKEVLGELFMQYPPGDEEDAKERVGKDYVKPEKFQRRKDPLFRKPSMSKDEIAKKVESHASKMKKSKITQQRSKLPMASYRDVVTSAVESHQVVLVSGETGCGKTTQVPQYLLDHMWGKGEACKIVCTQPRRISAISVAERIAYERGQTVGEDIGYKIRLESKGGRHSSIVFCTNGILLRILISKGAGRSKTDASNKETKQQDLSDITHIIVDEIHERDRHSDLMLAILRDMLPSHPHLHLILMSATVDAERFAQYFGGCPVIRVPGFTYPVKTFYLEDVLSILKSVENNHLDNPALGASTEDRELTDEDKLALDEAISLAWSNDEFDQLLELVSTEGTRKLFNYQHSVTGLTPLMVFAGKGRVGDVCMLLSFGADCQLRAKDGTTALELAKRVDQGESAQMLKAHMESALSNSMEEQKLLDKYLQYFNPENIDVILIEQLLRKICSDSKDGAILVFLPGWDDINRTRERLLLNPYFRDSSKFVIISLHSMVPSVEQKKVFNRPPSGCRKIVLSTNIAETAVTIDDVVYVINSGRMKEKNYDPFNNVSTLQSSWVSKASAKQRQGRAGRCQPGICYHLYSKLRAAALPDFQVPEIKRVPIEELCLQVKLLDPDCKIDEFLNKTLDPPHSETIRNAISVLQDIGALSLDEKLTELGEKLGSLPVHPLTSKMLFFAILMNCLEPALTLACAADYKDPFSLPMVPDEKKRFAAAKSELSSLYGGHSDQLAVIAAFDCWKVAKKRGQEKQFCAQYFVSSGTMNMLSGMRMQLQTELIRLGFIPEDVSRCSLNAHNPGILQAVLVAGLYPMLGRLIPSPKGGNGKRSIVEIANGSKVRLHSQSTNFKLSLKIKDGGCPLVVYDEITRGDGGSNIRNCTVVGPLPLLLLSTEIAVAPANDDDDDDDGEGSDVDDNEDERDEDAMEIDGKSGGQHKEKIMSSPDKSVMVIVDRWLYFGSKALEVAQIYCLRERLSTAILFKVTHPKEVLPPDLGASVYAIACVLSYDGLSGISLPKESVDSPDSDVKGTEIDIDDSEERLKRHQDPCFLKSLFNDNEHFLRPRKGHETSRVSRDPHQRHQSFLRAREMPEMSPEEYQNFPHQQKSRLPPSNGGAKFSGPLSQNVCPPLGSACTNSHQEPPSQGTNFVAANGAVSFYVIGNEAAKLSDPLGQSIRPPLESGQKSPSQGTGLPALNGAAKVSDPSSHIVLPPLDSAFANTNPPPPSQVPNPVGPVAGNKRKKHRNRAA